MRKWQNQGQNQGQQPIKQYFFAELPTTQLMSGIAQAVAVGLPHHVTQRGNGRQRIFCTDRDREIYLDMFFDYASRYSLPVWGYCLMSNHVHSIVAPETEYGLARAFGHAHADYARYATIVQRIAVIFGRRASTARGANKWLIGCWTGPHD